MNRLSGTDEGLSAPGRRLERYVKERWTRQQGGMLKLAAEIGSSTETIYSWFRGDAEPSMAHLRSLAEMLGVRRSVLVAVLDGDPLPGETAEPETVESRLRALEAGMALLAQRIGVDAETGADPEELTPKQHRALAQAREVARDERSHRGDPARRAGG